MRSQNESPLSIHFKRLILCFILFSPVLGYTQSTIQFTKDAIPIFDKKVVFRVEFTHDLSKEEFHRRSYTFLNDILNPYLGHFSINSNDSTVSRIIDYLDINSSVFQTFGMYMTYKLKFEYNNGKCIMYIEDITYMEKQYFETQENSNRKLHMPEYSAKDIMIDERYSLLLIRNASERVTDASLIRINEVIRMLNASFGKK